LPVRDPAQASNERWLFKGDWTSDVLWNFGIGYPF